MDRISIMAGREIIYFESTELFTQCIRVRHETQSQVVKDLIIPLWVLFALSSYVVMPPNTTPE